MYPLYDYLYKDHRISQSSQNGTRSGGTNGSNIGYCWYILCAVIWYDTALPGFARVDRGRVSWAPYCNNLLHSDLPPICFESGFGMIPVSGRYFGGVWDDKKESPHSILLVGRETKQGLRAENCNGMAELRQCMNRVKRVRAREEMGM